MSACMLLLAAGLAIAALPAANAKAPAAAEATPTAPASTALVPPPSPGSDHAADRIYDPAAMAAARAVLRKENGGMVAAVTRFSLAEYQWHAGRNTLRWDGEFVMGGDIDQLVVSTEGKAAPGGGAQEAEAQLLWSHAAAPYFNLEAGLRHDFAPGSARNYATLAVAGTAPYWLDVEAAVFLSDRGQFSARAKVDYDERLTQSLILQPRAELNFAATADQARGVAAGLSSAELGLRLRYEIRRRFAPYVGVSWEWNGEREDGPSTVSSERRSTTALVTGIRAFF